MNTLFKRVSAYQLFVAYNLHIFDLVEKKSLYYDKMLCICVFIFVCNIPSNWIFNEINQWINTGLLLLNTPFGSVNTCWLAEYYNCIEFESHWVPYICILINFPCDHTYNWKNILKNSYVKT